jgi:hypothetical protein
VLAATAFIAETLFFPLANIASRFTGFFDKVSQFNPQPHHDTPIERVRHAPLRLERSKALLINILDYIRRVQHAT